MPDTPGTVKLFDPVHVLKPGSQPSAVLAAFGPTRSLSGNRGWFAWRDGTTSTRCLIVVGLHRWVG